MIVWEMRLRVERAFVFVDLLYVVGATVFFMCVVGVKARNK